MFVLESILVFLYIPKEWLIHIGLVYQEYSVTEQIVEVDAF